jgi:hypothetical protein
MKFIQRTNVCGFSQAWSEGHNASCRDHFLTDYGYAWSMELAWSFWRDM